MNIGYTFSVSSTLVAAVTATTIGATADVSDSYAIAQPTSSISASVYVVPLTPLAEQTVFVGESAVLNIGVNTEHTVDALDSDAKTFERPLADVVSVTESTFKVFTNPVDFDPSDDDVDPTPVFMADADEKVLSRPDVADAVVSGDTPELAPEKVLSDVIPSPTDVIDRFDVALVKADTASPLDQINQFRVTTEFDDAVTITDTPEKNFTLSERTDDVTMLGESIKVFNSSVDFDPSDDDVDPDPITPTDQINTFGIGLGKVEVLTATETSAKDFTFGGFADSVAATEAKAIAVSKPFADSLAAVEGIKLNPALGKTESVSATDAINKFDPRLSKTDTVSPSDAINQFSVVLVKADAVTATDVAVKNFTENVDYDRSDADADADPVVVSELLAASFSTSRSEGVSAVDVNSFTVSKLLADAAVASENIYLQLILGESEYVYPDRVTISDGSNGFVQDAFRFTKADLTAQLGGSDSLLNGAIVWGGAVDDLARESYTGIIGSAGFVGQVVVNSDTITYPDQSSAGLIVNFHYTDAEDTTLGGYYFNQTPISAGAIDGGVRTIL